MQPDHSTLLGETAILPRLRTPRPLRSRMGAALRKIQADHISKTTETVPAADDRRLHPRHDSGCVVAVYCCREDERIRPQDVAWRLHAASLKGLLLDISMGGAGVLLPQQVAGGTRILLRLTNRALGDHCDTTAVVIRSTPAGEEAWQTICRFTQTLTLEQVQSFGRHLFASTIV